MSSSGASGILMQDPMIPKIIKKVAWLPTERRKVLFARSAKEPTIFYTIGGKIKHGETQVEALVRETKEETGATIHRNTIQHLHSFEGPCHGYPEGTRLEMECYSSHYHGQLTPSGEVAELCWFTSRDAYRTTDMGKEILEWLQKNNYID